MMIHTGDKKEQCRFCGKLFYFAKDLARHERTHTGEKPFKCDLCEKSFNVKQHLTLHRRIHTGYVNFWKLHTKRVLNLT